MHYAQYYLNDQMLKLVLLYWLVTGGFCGSASADEEDTFLLANGDPSERETVLST